jgi:hypothetical protein
MCGGGGSNDNDDIQRQQLTEAADARWREQERQNRIDWGTGYIDDVFGGGVAGRRQLKEGVEYDPTRTYYTADGEVWKPMANEDVFSQNQNIGDFSTPAAMAQFADLLKNGAIYAKTDRVRGFNDKFYDKRRDAYLGYYQPQLDDQFAKAKEQLTFALARAGTLNSTFAADKQGELQNKYATQQASVLSQANADVASAKSRINNEKSALVSQLNATGDADRISNEALARTQQLFQEKPAYNPLGDIFAGVAAGIGNAYGAYQNNQALKNYYGTSGGGSGGSGGVYTVY